MLLVKLLLMSNFSFSTVLEKIYNAETKKKGLFGRGLNSRYINPLPHDKILALFKLKAFADNNFNLAQMAQSFFEGVENIVVKGENAGYQHFLLFP